MPHASCLMPRPPQHALPGHAHVQRPETQVPFSAAWQGHDVPIERGKRGSGKALSGFVSFGWGLSQYVLCLRPSSILLSAPRHTWSPLQGCLEKPSTTVPPPAALVPCTCTIQLPSQPVSHCARVYADRAAVQKVTREVAKHARQPIMTPQEEEQHSRAGKSTAADTCVKPGRQQE